MMKFEHIEGSKDDSDEEGGELNLKLNSVFSQTFDKNENGDKKDAEEEVDVEMADIQNEGTHTLRKKIIKLLPILLHKLPSS